jgi:Bacterial transcriptional activator domain/Transcriptional regulatory protein, C terminal
MRFRMLGPLLVGDGASWSAVRAAQQRLVAAVLLLEAGRAVPVERLVDELWRERPPPSAAATVRGYVMRLRRLLGDGPDGSLVTRGRGYELVVADGDVDARVFAGLVTSARHALTNGQPETAAAKLSQGLALWRGPALADVQLYVDLRGWAAGAPLRPLDALAGFLAALGVPAAEVPDEVARAAALYRSLLAGNRVLVVLDNARSPGQVRPLLPASPGCAVVLTSRDQLRGLVARDGAVRLDLDVLAPWEARALLTRLLGAQWVDAEPQAAAELVRLCGHLPLALRIAAANLSSRPRTTVAAYAAELAAGDRLRALQAGEDADAAVRVAFDRSYAALPAAARRLLRLLGLVPGAGIGPRAAAALAGTDHAAAAVLLDRLASAHLAGEHAPNRYVLHDLLRLYAAERSGAEDSSADREAALGRLSDHNLHGVDPDSPATHRQHTPPAHTAALASARLPCKVQEEVPMTRRRLRLVLIAVTLAALLVVLTASAAFAPTAVEYAVML